MNPQDSRTLTFSFSDLFNTRYSTNTVGEHPTETRSKAPGYNGVFFILKSSNFAKNKISPDEPPWLQDPNSLILIVNGLV